MQVFTWMQTIQSVALGTKVALFVGIMQDKLHILVFEELFFCPLCNKIRVIWADHFFQE